MTGSSTLRTPPESIPLAVSEPWGGSRGSAVKQRLGPIRDAQNSIEAHRQAASIDNYGSGVNHDERRPRRQDDRRRGGHYDSDDDSDLSWSPDQRGPRAFGQNVRNAKFPSRFRAPTNVPRHDEETNPSVCLEDYQLTCHAGGATNDLFIIKNPPLYLGDSARTWLGHLPRGKINDWTELR
jgi:hypothetical protein